MFTHRVTLPLFLVLHAIACAGWLLGYWGGLLVICSLLIHLGIVVIGSFAPQAGFFIPHRSHGKPNTLALTYDDGPVPAHTGAILDLLRAEGVHATFFCIGERVASAPELAQRIVAEGHEIAVHTWSHPWWWGFLGRRDALHEIQACIDSIRGTTGVEPRLFRPPYGVTSPATAWAIRQSGLQPVAWDLRSFDTIAGKGRRTFPRVMRKLDKATIILMHDPVPAALQLTRAIIAHARNNGTALVKLSAMNNALRSAALLIGLGLMAPAIAQTQGDSLDRNDPLVQRLLEHSRNTTSLRSAFTQEKHLAVLTAPLISMGTIRFEQPGKLRWQVDTPDPFVAVMDGAKVRISEHGTEREVSQADQHTFAAINDLISGILSGRMLSGQGMEPTFRRTAKGLMAELVPKDKRVSKRLRMVVLQFGMDDMLLHAMTMEQSNGDRTILRFHGTELGVKHPATTFTIP